MAVEGIYVEAARVFSLETRLGKAIEEAAELISAIQHWRDNRISDVELADEIADMEIMCRHLRLVVGEGMVDVRRGIKQRRLRQLVDFAAVAIDQKQDWVVPQYLVDG